jgi:putative intracellular protease/amidase
MVSRRFVLATLVGAGIGLAARTNVFAQTRSQSRGRVLVVLSAAHELDLREGTTYPTGYYLNELAVPLRKIVDAGYTPVFANPNGQQPKMDDYSNHARFFGGDDAKRADALSFVQSFDDLRRPKTLSSVAKAGTRDFVGLFLPGGHAPMQDLYKDRDLGSILREFHETNRPTGIICHGPIALLSTLPEPEKFEQALIADDAAALKALSQNWPYAGYRLTVFSTAEEKLVEASRMQGHVRFYPDHALAKAGATIDNVAPWQSHVVEDRELLTGQQPFSDHAFGDALVTKLNVAVRNG